MALRRRLAVVAAAGLALVLSTTSAATASTTTAKPLGQRSLAAVLLANDAHYDNNWNNYSILTQAVLAVLKAKPHSAVGVLTDGSVPLTAFIPRDAAFRQLVKDITGKQLNSEQAVFTAVAGLGIDTVETVLLYHVVPGATITKKQAVAANGAHLTTAQGGVITVSVYTQGASRIIHLADADTNSRNPRVVAPDINIGNRQIAHGIDRVLRPIDLPN